MGDIDLLSRLLNSMERDAPVFYNLVNDLVGEYPDWKLTHHTDEDGYRYTMIEWADEDGLFQEGAPGKFVSFVSGLASESASKSGGSK